MIIERLDPQRHDRAAFTCGEPSLDQFLQAHARKYFERGLGVTWVAVSEETPARIDGYYTLAMSALLADELQSSRICLQRISVVLLGRLAVAAHAQGGGLGTQLLMHALHTACHLSLLIGAHAVLVDPLNERVTQWYSRYGFQPLPGASSRMILPMVTLRAHVRMGVGETDMGEMVRVAKGLMGEDAKP